MYYRAVTRITRLQESLDSFKNEMKEISSTHFQKIFKNSSKLEYQAELIYEILNASKVNNPTNRIRYSKNRML